MKPGQLGGPGPLEASAPCGKNKDINNDIYEISRDAWQKHKKKLD
jgi:hypothetical protein